MNRTRLLVALLVVVILLQLFPEKTAIIELVAVSAGALYCLSWAISRYVAQYQKRAAQAAQDAADADADEYRQYEMELDSIRAKYDPNGNLTDPTSISQEYKDELSALHDKHETMLTRKFGSVTQPGPRQRTPDSR